MSRTLTIIFGVAFMSFGLWIYRHPGQAVPEWSISTESVRLQFGTALGILIIFVSCASTFIQIVSFVFPFAATFIALPLAVVATWYLIKKVFRQGSSGVLK